jgi:hypothetical protein
MMIWSGSLFADFGKSFDMSGKSSFSRADQTVAARRATARASRRTATGSAGIAVPFTRVSPLAAVGLKSPGRRLGTAAAPSSWAKNFFRDGLWVTGREK